MSEELRQQFIETITPREAWLKAKKAWIDDLRKRYSGIDGTVTGQDARKHGVRFSRLMREWNPIHCSVEDLKSIAGEPRRESSTMIEYFFDQGLRGSGYRFSLHGGTIVGIEYLPGE